MVRRPKKHSSGTPGSSRVRATSQRHTKPLTNPPRPGQKTRSTPGGQQRSQKQGFRSRFSREHHIVFEGRDKTHRISLRLATIMMFALIGVLIIANPLTQYLAQQEEIRQAKSELAIAKERVETLEEEKALWSDPIFIQAQARERLGFVMPGQTLYIAKDPKQGDATTRLNKRTEEVNRLRREKTPFFVTGWDSLVIAGQVGERANPQNTPILNDSPESEAPAPESPTTESTPPESTPTQDPQQESQQ